LDERAAVPDVRDGLTTAGRCALWALHAAGTRNRGYVKSSRIVVVVDGAPRTLTLKQAIARWIEHRRDVIARRPGATARSSTAPQSRSSRTNCAPSPRAAAPGARRQAPGEIGIS
jgi:DNA gyrase/topoisomerase IV subunit A